MFVLTPVDLDSDVYKTATVPLDVVLNTTPAPRNASGGRNMG